MKWKTKMNPNPETSPAFPCIYDEKGELIAETFGNSEACIKNSYLLASAPDLLEALEALLVERYCCTDDEEFDENGNWTSNSPASIKARQAISKARGEA